MAAIANMERPLSLMFCVQNSHIGSPEPMHDTHYCPNEYAC